MEHRWCSNTRRNRVEVVPNSPPYLPLEDFAIETAALDQFLMTAALDDAAGVEDENLVGVPDR